MRTKEKKHPNKKHDDIFSGKTSINHYIKDPVHREINFANEKWLLEFAYSFEMLRLLEIRQLGIGYKIFPSATHNRYSHCLGPCFSSIRILHANPQAQNTLQHSFLIFLEFCIFNF